MRRGGGKSSRVGTLERKELGTSQSLKGPCDPQVLPLVLPLLERLPSPTTVSREIPEAAESAGMLPGLCLLPMLITAADMWPGPRGCWPQPLGAGQDGGQHVGKPTCLSHWPGGHTDSPMPQLRLASKGKSWREARPAQRGSKGKTRVGGWGQGGRTRGDTQRDRWGQVSLLQTWRLGDT